MQRIDLDKSKTASPQTFHQLLNWLDQGVNSDGQRYLEMRRRLVAYFDRKNCPEPDNLADETFDRVARRLAEEGVIEAETPAKYCYIVARFVFMEQLRERQKGGAAMDDLRRRQNFLSETDSEEKLLKETMSNCLEECLKELEFAKRDMILRYYTGTERLKIENRRSLAASLGITMNALSIRACRIRDQLENCVRKCAGMKMK